MKKYILALDQGTTSSRAVIFDEKQNIIGFAQKNITQYYPKSGWVEHDSEEIFQTQKEAAEQAVAAAGIRADEIAAAGITNQRETTIVWNKKTGKTICNAIVWQCRRAADIADKLKETMGVYIKKTTGLIPDSYFSGPKIKWILENIDGAAEMARNGELLFGTVDTWLIWKFTNGKVHATDVTNASRTMFFDIHRLCWDKKLMEAMSISENMLPEVKSCSDSFGYLEIDGVQIPIMGVIGDQQSALFGQCCFYKGEYKITYGTGCFLLMNIGENAMKSNNSLITTVAYSINGRAAYALEGSVFIGGAVIKWLEEGLGVINNSQESEIMASSVEDTGGVYFVPAFTGLGAPYWNQHARGCIVGITRYTKKEHIVRAALEGIAYQCHDVAQAMNKDTGCRLEKIRVDGGASKNGMLMQFQADILNAVIERPVHGEMTALGAAMMSGLGSGMWKSLDELKALSSKDEEYKPSMKEETREMLLDGWRRAVDRSLDWAEE